MHGTVPRKPLQTLRHVDQVLYLLVIFIGPAQLRILLKRFIDRDVQLLGDHLRDTVHKRIGKIHHTPHVADHAPRRQSSESDDLHYPVLAVLAHHIIDDLLPSLIAEVHVDIGHGHTLRVQEPLKQELIADRVNGGDLQAVGDDASRRRPSSRSDRDPVVLRILDEIPYDKEIIHISHVPDRIKLIAQAVLQLLGRLRSIPLLKPLPAELLQIFP